MADKQITQLSATTSPLASGDLIVIEKADGSGTKKMTYNEFIKAVSATMLTQSGAVTDSLHAVNARELNASISGTVAEKVSSLIRGKAFTQLAEGTDLDTLYEDGWFYTGDKYQSISNFPPLGTYAWSIIEVKSKNGLESGVTYQIAYNNVGSIIAVRNRSGNPMRWNDWNCFVSENYGFTDLSSNVTWNSAYIDPDRTANMIKVSRKGAMVKVGGEFKLTANASVSATVLASGFPKGSNNTLNQFVGMNVTSGNPVMLCINTSGNLITYYAGSFSANESLRFSTYYYTYDAL